LSWQIIAFLHVGRLKQFPFGVRDSHIP
jgi:hypothetical protein